MASYTFNGTTKIITVGAEVSDTTTITAVDLYSRWKDWVAAGNAQFSEAFAESVGGNLLGGGAQLDGYIFLRNDLGWRIKPDERDHSLVVEGNLFGFDANTASFSTTTGDFTVLIRQVVSSKAQLVSASGAFGSTQATQLLELYLLADLDPTKPLVVNDTGNTRRVPSDGSEIDQTVVTSGGTTTVTRV